MSADKYLSIFLCQMDTTVYISHLSLILFLVSGLLILCDGAISHNRPQIASDRTIQEKSHSSQKNAQHS